MDFPVGPFENERLSILYESGLLDGSPNPVLEDLCQKARKHFNVETVLVTLLEEDIQSFLAKSGDAVADTSSMPRCLAFCNFTILKDDLFVVPDTLQAPDFQTHPAVVGAPFIRFYAGAPLIYMENIRLGAFCLIDGAPAELTSGQREELREFADIAVAELVRVITKAA